MNIENFGGEWKQKHINIKDSFQKIIPDKKQKEREVIKQIGDNFYRMPYTTPITTSVNEYVTIYPEWDTSTKLYLGTLTIAGLFLIFNKIIIL